MTTAALQASDFEGAKRWYTELLGVEPYFDRPYYAEFRIGDHQHELGILNAAFTGELGGVVDTSRPGGVILYWHVDDVDATLERLLALGAQEFQPKREFGEGFVGAAVVDPFGNVLGVMHNPHYLEVLAASGR